MNAFLSCLLVATILPFGSQGTPRMMTLGGHPQKLHIYGPPSGRVVILSSGDGGWVHLAPHLADILSARGYFVVGFDVKNYLSAGTDGQRTLSPADITRDYATLLSAFGASQPPVLAGVSEGAGLSVLAASDASNNRRIAGVVTFGLGEINELAWRWKDAAIYVTHGVPNEPTFSVSSFLPRVAPAPLALIRPTRDEYVSRAESDRLVGTAGDPKRAWTVPANDHRFSDNLDELDRVAVQALEWLLSSTR